MDSCSNNWSRENWTSRSEEGGDSKDLLARRNKFNCRRYNCCSSMLALATEEGDSLWKKVRKKKGEINTMKVEKGYKSQRKTKG